MKLKMLMASFVFAGFTGTALANDLSHTITLNANVGQICSFSNEIVIDGPGLSDDAGVISMLVEINSDNSEVIPIFGSVKFGNSFCNTASDITFSRTPFTTTASAENGFANEIMYAASVKWGQNTIAELLLGGLHDNSKQLAAPQTGDIELIINIAESDPLVTGIYQSVITLAISAS